MEIQEISKSELVELNGGDLYEAAFKTVWTIWKYSSLTGAVATGLIEGYIEGKLEQQ